MIPIYLKSVYLKSVYLKPRPLTAALSVRSIKPTQSNVLPIKTLLSVSMLAITLMGCQSRPANHTTGPTLTPIIANNSGADAKNLTFATTTNPDDISDSTILFLPSRLPSFSIEGKIGAVIPATDTQPLSSGSAFYAWAQEDNRFAVDLTGALGIGRTHISYDGQVATLSSERTGIVTATNPEALLTQATGWRAPISQLPYWISGSPAPSDNKGMSDNYRRLIAANNGDWAATFNYADNNNATVPNKINLVHGDGHKLVMTIKHNLPPEIVNNVTPNQTPDTHNDTADYVGYDDTIHDVAIINESGSTGTKTPNLDTSDHTIDNKMDTDIAALMESAADFVDVNDVEVNSIDVTDIDVNDIGLDNADDNEN